MLHLHNINPMVRAVGTMGAVSVLVGGITFTQLTSNAVALSSNTLSTGSPSLKIGALSMDHHHDTTTGDDTDSGSSTSGTTTTNTSCDNLTNGTIPGFDLTGSNGLLPGATSAPLSFCLKNGSTAPLDLTVAIPNNPFSSVSTSGLQPSNITLDVTCANGDTSTGTLDAYVTSTSSTPMALGSLAANSSTTCQATVELSNTVTLTGTESLPSFDIEFTGTTTTS